MSLAQKLGFQKKPLYLMDGNAFIFRGYYANAAMSRSDGFPTGALYIVGRTLLKILREEEPGYFCFVLDGHGPNFRHELYPDYKANRPPAPEDLIAQIEPVKALVRALGIHVEVSDGCEADDCMASLAERWSRERPVVMIGLDKDLKQCLSPTVVMWDPAGKNEKIVTEASFREETGLSPSQWPDVQALIGDSSDNIPGVRGIGEKTAMKLFADHQDLEALRDDFDALPPSVKKKLEGNLDAMFLYRRLTTLDRSRCEHLGPAELAVSPAEESAVLTVFREFEMHSLSREFSSMMRMKRAAVQPARRGSLWDTGNGFDAVQEATKTVDAQDPGDLPDPSGHAVACVYAGQTMHIAVGPAAAETEAFFKPTGKTERSLPMSGSGKTASAASKPSSPPAGPDAGNAAGHANKKTSRPSLFEALSSPMAADQGHAPAPESPAPETASKDASGTGREGGSPAGSGEYIYSGSLAWLVPYLQKAGIVIVCGHKELVRSCPAFGSLQNCMDLGIAAWLLAPEDRDYGWPKLLAKHCAEYGLPANAPAEAALSMHRHFSAQMAGRGLLPVLFNIEMPLSSVLAGMEQNGIAIDLSRLKAFLGEVSEELKALTRSIYEAAGGPFNIRSAQQIGELLFKKLGLRSSGETRGGQAKTSADVLDRLAGDHPVVRDLLEYRKLEKIRSTYLEPLPQSAGPDGRVHTTFNITATATGRLSSSNPNLQNIPVRGDMGRRMRSCFTAAPGHKLISADYSQIELRVLAHCSGDEKLKTSFLNGEDIHARTAAELFGLPMDAVSPDLRRKAKTINFGLIYGMGARKLAQDLSIPQSEAKRFMEEYFKKFSDIKAFFDSVENYAREHACVVTLAGRQRPLPDIRSQSGQARALAERQAVNTLIQGTAADIIKIAMLAAAQDGTLRDLGAKLLLQIHDELVAEVPEQHAETAAKRLAELMQDASPDGKPLSVPLIVEYGIGQNWGEAH